jgi:hypothetical protein
VWQANMVEVFAIFLYQGIYEDIMVVASTNKKLFLGE